MACSVFGVTEVVERSNAKLHFYGGGYICGDVGGISNPTA